MTRAPGLAPAVLQVPRWMWRRAALVLLGLTSATVLVIQPRTLAPDLALLPGLVLVFILPGYFLLTILEPLPRGLSLARLPPSFVASLAVWALPATALQVVGATWGIWRVLFLVLLWVLGLGVLARSWRARSAAASSERALPWIEIVLAALCGIVALVVAVGPRDSDDWMYLQIAQQILGSSPFHILKASEARYSIRYAFHVWIFLQAFLGEWLHVDLVNLVRDQLPVLLAPLALLSFYGWAKTFFGRARPALAATVIQLLIYFTFVSGDGWGRGFFQRSAQDKFLVWLVILPVALTFAWNFLQQGKVTDWFLYGAAMLAGLWVHSVSLFLVVLALGGFALFNLISRRPFARRRWLALVIASLPALLAPVVIRATTLPAVFRVNVPDVAAYIRLMEGKLLFQGSFYMDDPGLVAHPLILLSFAALVLWVTRLRTDARAQFLWGSMLAPLALLYNPIGARILGELLTPWQLWRLTWNLPAAFILTYAGLQAPGWLRVLSGSRRKLLLAGTALGLVVVAALSLSEVSYARTFAAFTKGHAFGSDEDAMMRTLTATLTRPSNVLLPRNLTRFASAYSYNAVVMSNDAQKPEDTIGQEIDRFYDNKAEPKILEDFLNHWQIEYVVTTNDSLQDRFMRGRAQTQMLYRNDTLTLYNTVSHKLP